MRAALKTIHGRRGPCALALVFAVLASISGTVNGFAGHFAVGLKMTQTSGDVRVRRGASIAARSPELASTKTRGGAGPRMTVDGEQELGFVDKFKTGWTTVIPVGDPADLPPCPSGVSQMVMPLQAAIFAAVFGGLGTGTVVLLGGLASLESALPAGWYSIWQFTWAPLLGLVFAAAGVSHFTLLREFSNIYPGRGAWGFWYLPGTASFHVKWTGIAEFALGVGLALGGLGVGTELGLEQAAAWGLFALTLAVTPANIYMFSHGAQLPEGLEVPVVGHAIRGVFQCVLLALFWTLATQ